MHKKSYKKKKRKKMRYIIAIIITIISLNCQAQKKTAKEIIEQKYGLNSAFMPGEVLEYEISYGPIKGGTCTITMGLMPCGYDYLFHAKAVLKTQGMISAFAHVYDIYESYFSVPTGMPIKAIRNVTENNYKRYNEDLFCIDSSCVYSMKSGKHDVPKYTFDILSAFYFSRRFLMDTVMQKNQTSMDLATWFNEDLYNVKLKYKKNEELKTKFGKLQCIKYVPLLDHRSPFKKEDDMQAYFTDDKRFVPVLIKCDLPVGSLKCKLINYKNLKEVENPQLP